MENYKLCKPCNTLKPFSEFGKFKKGKFGLNSHCKLCRKKYDFENREKFLEYHKIKRQNELDKFKAYDKKYKTENRHKQNEYNSKKWKNDLQYKIKKIIRTRFYSSLKMGIKYKSTLLLLGCDIDKFKQYLENQFFPEFTWENHGIVWEIDHILPCASFDLSILENQQKCFHYTNMKPIFKTTEIAKSFGYIYQIGNRNKKDKIQ